MRRRFMLRASSFTARARAVRWFVICAARRRRRRRPQVFLSQHAHSSPSPRSLVQLAQPVHTLFHFFRAAAGLCALRVSDWLNIMCHVWEPAFAFLVDGILEFRRKKFSRSYLCLISASREKFTA